jgi:hypothetical protein
VRDYSRRSLTYPEDKLPAIAGIASRVNTVLNDTYIAGHFKSSLPESLLWHIDGDSGLLKDVQKYRAPSWSWASMDCHIRFLSKETKHGATICSVENMHVELVEPTNTFGQVSEVFLELRGPCSRLSNDINLYMTVSGSANVESFMASSVGISFDSVSKLNAFDWTTAVLLLIQTKDHQNTEIGLVLVPNQAPPLTSRLEDPPLRFRRLGWFTGTSHLNEDFKGYSYASVTIE